MRASTVFHACLTASLIGLVGYEVGAAEFSSLRGFALEYPDSWCVATSAQQDAITSEAGAMFNKLGNVNWNAMAVVIFNPEEDEFAESVNVVVAPGVLPLGEDAGSEIADQVVAQYSSLGIDFDLVKMERTTARGKDALSITADVEMPGFDRPLRQRQVIVPGRTQTYIVTCGAFQEDFEEYEPVFTQVVDSLQVDSGVGGVWYCLPTVIRYAIIGGLVGLAFSVVSSVFKG